MFASNSFEPKGVPFGNFTGMHCYKKLQKFHSMSHHRVKLLYSSYIIHNKTICILLSCSVKFCCYLALKQLVLTLPSGYLNYEFSIILHLNSILHFTWLHFKHISPFQAYYDFKCFTTKKQIIKLIIHFSLLMWKIYYLKRLFLKGQNKTCRIMI